MFDVAHIQFNINANNWTLKIYAIWIKWYHFHSFLFPSIFQCDDLREHPRSAGDNTFNTNIHTDFYA